MSKQRQSAVVTGSSRGIARAIAEQLAADGVAVAINYACSPQEADEAVRGIVERGGRAIAIQADISIPGDVRRLFDEAEKFSGPPDIVVANAGAFPRKPITQSTEEDCEDAFNANKKGVFVTLREAGKRVNEGGRIVAVSSGARKMPWAGASLYLGGKRAIEQFARSLSRELGPRFIAVNVLSSDSRILSK